MAKKQPLKPGATLTNLQGEKYTLVRVIDPGKEYAHGAIVAKRNKETLTYHPSVFGLSLE